MTETETRPDRMQYRLIITRQKASEILLSTRVSNWSLPQVEVLNGVRFTEQLLARVKQDHSLETYCLGTQCVPPPPGLTSTDRYAVLETLQQGDEAHPATMWISSAAAASEATLSPADRSVISSWQDDLDRYIAGREARPFAMPGWIKELFCWVRDQIEPLGLTTTGGFRQLNASSTFSLMRIETNSGAVWFKATGEPNVQELPISIALDRAFPAYVPAILGVHPNWNGWLSEEVPGRRLDLADPQDWANVARALAELQIASAHKTDMLMESGCQDLRPQQLAGQIDPFLLRMSELMAMQTSKSPHILTDSELRFLGDCVRGALCELQRHRIPSTLGHLDFAPGNILVSPTRCCFLDWSEGCLTHPFLTFEYLREHARRILSHDCMATETMVGSYLQPWRSLFSAETLAHALELSPLVAVFAYALAGNRWCSQETLGNPQLAGYFRSLARRAHCEATKIAARTYDV